NRGFRYGDGLFETILIRHGKPSALDAHLQRLSEGMQILGLDPLSRGMDTATWRQSVLEVVGKLLKGQDESGFGRMRITVHRAAGGHYLPISDAPELLAEIHPLQADPWLVRPPLHLCFAHAYPVAHSALSAVKSLNALPYVMAARHAAAQGLDDAILRSVKGEVVECSAANIFIVLQNRIVTPWLGAGCLPGVMRARVIAIAQAQGMLVQAQPVQIQRLNDASEIFVTSAIRGLQPVGSIAETTYTAKAHKVMSKIRDMLLEEVG
ncbi:MAG TPA: aminotransferase class IV, partial [Bacteroidia bacterium]|nr:aminotransferase class IV [Bacteroidia bacterium]